MTPNRLHFQKQSEAAPVGSTQAGDVAIGLRGTDFISIPLGLLGGNIPINKWDAAATEAAVPLEVIPYLRVENFTYSPTAWAIAPTTNVGKTSLKKAAITAGDTSVAGQLAGRLPNAGKFWFIVQADAGIMDAADSNWFELYFSKAASYIDMVAADKIVDFGYGFDYGWLGSANFTDGLTGARKYLLCVDIDAGQVDAYASTGLSASQTIAAVNGQPALAGAFINFNIQNYDGAAGELTFSVTAGDTPYAIPGGYNPLITYEADGSAVAGQISQATSDSIVRDYQIKSGRAYYLDSAPTVFELAIADQTPNLRRTNSFSQMQYLRGGVGLEDTMALRTVNGGVLITNENNALVARMLNNSYGPNFVIGQQSLKSMTSGQLNVVLGSYVGQNATLFTHSVALGNGLTAAKEINDVVAIGRDIGGAVMKAQGTTMIGATAANVTGYSLQNCVAIGYLSMSGYAADPDYPNGVSPIVVNSNTVVGAGSFYRGILGSYNTFLGGQVCTWYGDGSIGTGVTDDNVGIGYGALDNRQGNNSRNVVIGRDAMAQARNADENVILGLQAGYGLAGHYNVAIGPLALKNDTLGSNTNTQCTAVGERSMRNLTGVTNSAALGSGATVTGSNQVQLGNSATTVYAYGAVQNRSDSRDKREVRDTVLGLDFLLKVRPVDYKLDLREDYIDYSTRPVAPEALRPEPQPPSMAHTEEGYQEALLAYRADHEQWVGEKDAHDIAYRAWVRAAAEWDEANSMANVQTDGSKMRNRFHHGFIAQELKAAADSLGIDFGGYQDHAINGGQDVKSIGYEEMIAPSVRAIQELYEMVNSDAFAEKIAGKVLEMMMAARSGS